MARKKRLEFPLKVKKEVIERSGNRCERCNIDFNEGFTGEFHHIVSIANGGDVSIDNCSLLCRDCHRAAPNVRDKKDKLIYKYYFLKFASFREAAQYYGVDNKFDLYVKIAKDIANLAYNKKKSNF